ncbi:sugar-phosphate nucleotidyltransferase [Pyrodictium occultum]|uniref:Sugar-phosphate nucleotidyltransferase n=1 Tax=Pyrodictium occultum TaxID=2309 RepID=A0A0V8RS09_PYROC|nr:nucleotidyltransferase family protein [Pyrodictium occultum]KSW10749.1 sugar-phosphate nucleotidyltransferase [Pyrodictium occultum]
MEAVAAILAGGEGRRLRPYTDLIPKPMIPVGPEEKPVLEHIVEWIARHGVRDIVLLVGYKWRYIRNYFRDGAGLGARIRYSVDTPEYRGTGGALLQAYRRGLLRNPTLVWYGDILAALNPLDLLKTHEEKRSHATLAIATRYQVPVGVAEMGEDGRITGLREKPELSINATIGILAVDPSVLDEAEQKLGRNFDIMAGLIPYMIERGYRVYAYIYNGPWIDVGSMERYAKLDPDRLAEILNPENT